MPRRLGQGRVLSGFSLRLGQIEALREIADRERHGNVSLIVQNLIDEELERRGITIPTDAKATERKEAA